MGNLTFTMIKPDIVRDGHSAKILNEIVEAGFEIAALKKTILSERGAQVFYEMHSERPFFGELVEYITSGPIVVAVLRKDNAVADFRKLIGSTNPADADIGTIRAKYGKSLQENAIHGADSDENAEREINIHFSQREIF